MRLCLDRLSRIGGKISIKVMVRYGGVTVQRLKMTGMISEYMCVFVCMCVCVCVCVCGILVGCVGIYGW